jgi:serine/threonine protein kinase
MDTRQVVARFEAERQALAMMDHQNIAKVLDAGATESGRPYFAMELVHGVPITRYCDDNRLTPRERLELFVPICQAIQHAHTKGIIHRDVKPSNVLVTLYDGRPVPKVIDFGIAKATEQRLTDRTMFTQYGAAVGTFEYMSPEQAEMSALGVDTRSDVYSLGVLLYELLTGTTPLAREKLQQAGLTEKLRMIREDEPHRPSTQLSRSDTLQKVAAARKTDPAKLTKLLRGELDWIVMKCLEKDRTRRYETANALARDVQRYLADEPVEACPPSATYRLRRLARKHRPALLAAGAFVLLLMLAVVVSSWLAVRATSAERKASDDRDRALASQKELQMALTRQAAERLEKDQAQFAALGHALAAMMAVRDDWDEKQLRVWMEAMLAREERIFGLWVAFEPDQFPHKKGYYSLYTSRKTGEIDTERLLPPPEGKYNYPTLEFYVRACKTGNPFITEPLFDEEGAHTWILVRYIPFKRNGRVAGVVTVDLSVRYFSVLRDWLQRELKLGQGSYGFILSNTGGLITHPHTDLDLWRDDPQPRTTRDTPPPRVTDLPGIDPTFRALVESIQKGEDGSARAVDPMTGKEATFLFVPMKSLGWTFVAVVPDP